MTPDNAARNVEKLNQMGPVSIVIYVIIVTMWSIDLVMTITPGWVTSIIGFLYVVGQGLSSWALFAVLTAYVAGGKPPLSQVPTRYIRDIGNFTLAFTLLWSYMSYSQFLITFSGNQAEEALFYEWRQKGGWQIVGLLLLGAHFILPFLALLSSSVKTHISSLAKLGLIIIFMPLCRLVLLDGANVEFFAAHQFAGHRAACGDGRFMDRVVGAQYERQTHSSRTRLPSLWRLAA